MISKELGRRKRHLKIRKRIKGTTERPRLSVHRSLNNLYVQLIDDISAKTLFAFSTADKSFAKSAGKVSKSQTAAKLGEVYADKIKEKGFTKIAFDRSGFKYHGRIKALAESLRQKGIQF